MGDWTAATVAGCGLSIGILVGHAIRRGRLCSFGAIEDAVVAADFRRMKVFGLSLAVAIAVTQALVLFAGFDPAPSGMVPPALAWGGAVLGGLCFGLGMALVGTCAFGSLVRLGGGDLRALVTLLILGLVAQATLRGAPAELRRGLGDFAALALPDLPRGDIPALLEAYLGIDARAPLAILVTVVLVAWALADRRLRRTRRMLTAGAILGLGVAAGWAVTGTLADPFAENGRPMSLTFVGPVARLLHDGLMAPALALDFAVASVPGVALGAALAAHRAHEFRWEAFDDHHEMRRHLLGAVLMGFGGVLAGGCTIGQGLSGNALLSLSAPLALAAMIAGARLGIAFLVEGRLPIAIRLPWLARPDR